MMLRLPLIFLCFLFVLFANAENGSKCSLKITLPGNASRIDVYEKKSVNFTVSIDKEASDCESLRIRIHNESEEPVRSKAEPKEAEIKRDDDDDEHIFTVTGTLLGHSRIWFSYWNESSNEWHRMAKVEVATLRVHRLRDRIFQLIIIILLIFGNIGIGLTVNWSDICECLKKPIGPAIGFCCQYIIMPLTAFIVVTLLDLKPSIALGIFIVGCSPGGGGSNYHTYFLGGNLPLSVTMTIISTVGALAMMPLWIYTLGSYIASKTPDGIVISIPFDRLVISLACTVIPFAIGITVRFFRPSAADKAFRYIVRPMLVVVFLYLIT